MPTPIDKAFFATDVYDHWAERIAQAEEAVLVIASLTDDSLAELLAVSNVADVAVLASISPNMAGVGYREHLEGLRNLLVNDIEVRVTDLDLRANVLVCDSVRVTVGSQPFTTSGRQSSAATLCPGNSIQGSDFARELEGWVSGGRTLDLATLDNLLEGLDKAMRAVEAAQRELVVEFGLLKSTPSGYDIFLDDDGLMQLSGGSGSGATVLGETELRPVGEGLRRALTNTRKSSSERVMAQVRWVESSFDPYQSLVAYDDVDMTSWSQPRDNGSTQGVSLERLKMYPIILNPSGRMAFARVGKTRITYLRKVVSWTEPVMVSGLLCDLRVKFPDQGYEEVNLHLVLKPVNRSIAGVELHVRFDGMEGVVRRVVNLQRAHGEARNPSEGIGLAEITDDPHALGRLLDEALRPFRFKTLGRDRHNAGEFFPDGPQQVRLFRYGARSVLAVSDAPI